MATIYEGGLVCELSYRLDASLPFARKILQTIKANLSTHLINGDVVKLTSFGTFLPKKVAAKTLTNPQSGKPAHVPAHKCPAWRPARSLKHKVRKQGE